MSLPEEIRCRHCNKLLARGEAIYMEFKCSRCGAYTILRAIRPNIEPQDGIVVGKNDEGQREYADNSPALGRMDRR